MIKKVGLTNKMSGSIAKSKVEKRKFSAQVITQEVKANKVVTEKVKVKVPTKAELVIQMKAMQDELASLKVENTKNLEIIVTLETKVAVFKKEKEQSLIEGQPNSVKDLKHKICEYIEEDEYELDAHVWSEECDQHFTCCHCGRNFQTKADLMMHRKEEHEEKVKPCRHFLGGGCHLGEEDCWFSHSESSKDKAKITSFKCNFCEKSFDNRYEFMHHRKKEHVQSVPDCKKASNGTCWFGDKNCWFLHNPVHKINENKNNKNQEDGNLYNQEIIRKIFDMMETFTHRIMQLENKSEVRNN